MTTTRKTAELTQAGTWGAQNWTYSPTTDSSAIDTTV